MGDKEIHSDLVLGRSKKDPTKTIKLRIKLRSLPIEKGIEPGTCSASRNVPGSSIYVHSKSTQPANVAKQKYKIKKRVFKLAHKLKGFKWQRKKAKTVIRKMVEKEWNSDFPVSRRSQVGARRHIDDIS